jgi:hypothetical protein
MPLTSAQIVVLANQAAKTPGFTSQAGQKLNTILEELNMTYDIEVIRQTFFFTFNISQQGGTNTGTGPYNLPANYLRAQHGKVFYLYNGQPYFMTRVEQWEYDALIQQPGFMDFPRDFYVDTSQSPPQMFVWPPPSISVPVTVRYFPLMTDITTPETSAVVPWFPYQQYLITRLAGEMMALADDTRAADFLTDDEKRNPQGAGVLLRRYLTMKDDPEGRAKTVELDRRRFGNQSNWNRLPNTKSIGWTILWIVALGGDTLHSGVTNGVLGWFGRMLL